MKRILCLTIAILLGNLGYGQTDTARKVEYSADFSLNDGIYMNFQQFRSNDPIPKSRIYSDISYSGFKFYEKLFENNYFTILDNLGAREKIPVKKVWGYVHNDQIYVQWNGEFNNLSYVGNISHFIADKAVARQYPGGFYNGYTLNRSKSVKVTTEKAQYMLLMYSGKILEFTRKNVAEAISVDKELRDEYLNLKRKKQRKMKFYYIRKFNERNPLYFKIPK